MASPAPTPKSSLSSLTNASGSNILSSRFLSAEANNLSVSSLPIRAEKRIIPSIVQVSTVQSTFDQGARENGNPPGQRIQYSDFYISGAKKDLTDYVQIVVPHRGVNPATQLPDTTQDAKFKFLINPKTIAVSKQTVDGQAITRGGWQFGVWGEDISQISISGQSAGSIFALGHTDEYQYYAKSYRNILQLQQVFENNGYWFEGEEYNEGPLAADFLRRRIRMHQDVELWVGNFIWSGMFESLSISQTADNPFLITFNLTFLAWKERYRPSSGYQNSIINNVQRGHSYPNVEGSLNKIKADSTLTKISAISNNAKNAQISSTITNTPTSTSTSLSGSLNPYSNSPTVVASAAEDTLPTTNPQVMSTIGPINNLLNNHSFFLGVSN